jgi:hypothetical protein
VDSLFEQIIEDMDREGFTVSDKYKGKYDDLGKIQILLRAFFFPSSTFFFSKQKFGDILSDQFFTITSNFNLKFQNNNEKYVY